MPSVPLFLPPCTYIDVYTGSDSFFFVSAQENGSVSAGTSSSHLPQSYASYRAAPFWPGRSAADGSAVAVMRNPLRNPLAGAGPGLPGGPDAG